jgi:hypothetical protein
MSALRVGTLEGMKQFVKKKLNMISCHSGSALTVFKVIAG